MTIQTDFIEVFNKIAKTTTISKSKRDSEDCNNNLLKIYSARELTTAYFAIDILRRSSKYNLRIAEAIISILFEED